MPTTIKAIFPLPALAISFLTFSPVVSAPSGVTTHMGTLPDGATYLMEVPANWNGPLFLYSHGFVRPGSPNPAKDVGDPVTRAHMLSSGFALAGSSYATTGWAIAEALIKSRCSIFSSWFPDSAWSSGHRSLRACPGQ